MHRAFDPKHPSTIDRHTSRLDIRLVPAASLVWLSAVGGVWLAGPNLAALSVGLLSGAVLCAVPVRRPARIRPLTVTAFIAFTWKHQSGRGGSTLGRFFPRSTRLTASLALLLGGVMAGLGGSSAVARAEGPFADLVERNAGVVAEVTVTGSAREVRAAHTGAGTQWLIPISAQSMTDAGRVISGTGTFLAVGNGEWATAGPGARLRVTGTLAPPWPGLDTDGVLTVSSSSRHPAALPSLSQVALFLRRDFATAAGFLPPDARGLLPGMITGDTSALDESLEQAMKITGMTHLTAVSGANCSLVLTALLLGARSLRLNRGVAAAAALAGLSLFVVVVGPDPSVLRAGVMGAVGVSAIAGGRRGRALTTLCLAVMCLLFISPSLGSTIGFLLSVTATLGIILLANRIMALLPHRTPPLVAAVIAVPLSAQLMCGPIIVLLQPTLSPYALPANVLSAVVVTPVTLAGTAALALLWPVPFAASALLAVAGWCSQVVAGLARFFAGLPGNSMPWPEGPPGACTMALLSTLTLATLILAANPAILIRAAVRLHTRVEALLATTETMAASLYLARQQRRGKLGHTLHNSRKDPAWPRHPPRAAGPRSTQSPGGT
ncbi:ComEC/Rec2 family competence protein [Pseudarthrobacter sp. PS3-L1]|uniref:ComEC/Rec2 family competence protein n=1 Tax=Pseudarthrobacter sp. PS3-L1 TaxID=3046207 RepID=UPI0024B9F5C9|nr:ComEC/Rec2 family competence protein [Pseudarthrobacter sp. PS3-L1]MDJ0320087.1 ComEC/Rec2 family competence protein [Pseudarthrobacter sp. PS3-L1]